jgi:hypothetical protein
MGNQEYPLWTLSIFFGFSVDGIVSFKRFLLNIDRKNKGRKTPLEIEPERPQGQSVDTDNSLIF